MGVSIGRSAAGALVDEPQRGRRRPHSLRTIALICGLLASAHSLVYVFSVPPWATEDEEQHVDYILEIRDEHRIPRVDQTIRESIVRSTIATDRWGSLHLGVTSPDPDPTHRGLEGLSYEAYQPPLYYAVLAAVVAPAGHHLLTVMYLGRLIGAALAGVGAALTALLAARWCKCGRSRRAAWIAGLSLAAIPAYAEAGARINNDTGLIVASVASLLLLTSFIDRPSTQGAAIAGIAIGVSAGMKITGVVLLAPAAVALTVVWGRVGWRSRLMWGSLMAMPGAAVAVAWTLVSYERYGVFNPVTAMMERVIRLRVVPVSELARESLRLTGLPFGHWHTGPLVATTTAGLILAGIVLSHRCQPGAVRWLLVTAVVVGTIVGLLEANSEGILNAFNTRYVLIAYPPLIAAAATGWSRCSRSAGVAVVAAMWCVGATFFLAAFHPLFRFRAG